MKLRYSLVKSNKIAIDEEGLDYPICLTKINNDKVKTDCGHCFHMECIGKALKINTQCPCCRSNISNLDCKININNNYNLDDLKKKLLDFPSDFISKHPIVSITIGLPVFYTISILYIIWSIFKKMREMVI